MCHYIILPNKFLNFPPYCHFERKVTTCHNRTFSFANNSKIQNPNTNHQIPKIIKSKTLSWTCMSTTYTIVNPPILHTRHKPHQLTDAHTENETRAHRAPRITGPRVPVYVCIETLRGIPRFHHSRRPKVASQSSADRAGKQRLGSQVTHFFVYCWEEKRRSSKMLSYFTLACLVILYILFDVNYFLRIAFTIGYGRLFEKKKKIFEKTTIYGNFSII